MKEDTIKDNDVLLQASQLLLTPSKDTKLKILISVNATFLIVAIIHLFTQLATYGTLPDPARDMIMFPIIIVINGFSVFYNARVLAKKRGANRRWDIVTSWTSVLIIMLYAIAIVHSNPNTATSLLLDFSLSLILIFVASTVLGKRVALIWLLISIASLFIAIRNRGNDFEYHLLTKTEYTNYKELIQQNDQTTIALQKERADQKLTPLPIGLYFNVWIIFLLLTFLVAFFEGGLLNQILKVVPRVINNINIAAEQKNELEKENLRMGTELEVAKRIQTMVLPHKDELTNCKDIWIAARMDTAAEVGGDFYEVLPQKDGTTYLGIGDVTDHGLQSGVVMLMTQTIFRTLIENSKPDLKDVLKQMNTVLYKNIHYRLSDQRNLTLSLLEYNKGKVKIVGQHESILIYRANINKVEEISTMDLGIYIGLLTDINEYVHEKEFELNLGDIMLLYTDGITEAENKERQLFEKKNLCDAFLRHANKNVEEIIDNIYHDVYTFIGGRDLLDDMTAVILKRVK